jgi:hypothetical protein
MHALAAWPQLEIHLGIALIKIVELSVDPVRKAIGKTIKNAIAFAFLECRWRK